MKSLRHLENVSTLVLDSDKCVGCGMCTLVCPHGVLAMVDAKAVSLTPGVGCASYIIQVWLKGKEKASCGGSGCC